MPNKDDPKDDKKPNRKIRRFRPDAVFESMESRVLPALANQFIENIGFDKEDLWTHSGQNTLTEVDQRTVLTPEKPDPSLPKPPQSDADQLSDSYALDQRIKRIQALPSDDYTGRAAALTAYAAATRSVITAELAPALNARIRQADMPHGTYEQKKELARWVNDQLEPLGLAVKEPKTGLPGKLRAQTGNWPGVGAFAIEIYVGGKQKTPTTSDVLPNLELVDATPSQGPDKVWQEYVTARDSQPKHLLKKRSQSFNEIPTAAPQGISFEEKRLQASDSSHAFRQQLADDLATVLNAQIQSMPSETLEQKKELARFVNEQVEPLGLAVKDPRTGRPGKLRGTSNSRAESGFFQIEVKINGKQEYPTISARLPVLELMDADPPEAVRAGFRELVKRSGKSNQTGF